MTRRTFQARHAAWALLLAVVLLPLGGGTYYALQKHQWAAQRMAEIEPRYARLLGLEGSQAELQQTRRAVQAYLERNAYPATRDASQTGTEVQQRVRNVATVAGLSIVSSQVLPAKPEGPFDRIPLVLKLEGEIGALQAVLVVLANEAPLIHFDGFSVRTIGAVRADAPQRLDIQLNLYVLRVRP